MARHLLLDGYNLAFRSFYAIRELTRSDGFPTNALHGWIRTLWYLEDNEKADRMVAFFDLGGSTERQALMAQYKANRTEMPEALATQIPYIKAITQAMGHPVIEEEGIEADDLIAGVALDLAANGEEPVIVSADKDLGQVVGGPVRQLLPAPTANPKLGWHYLDAAGVEEKFGVPPARVPDYLALVGDASDNIPGIPGVGPRTAARWIKAYGGLESIIQNNGRLKPPRFQSVVHEMKEQLRTNLKMVTLDTSRGTRLPDESGADLERLTALLEEMEMKTAARDARKRYTPA